MKIELDNNDWVWVYPLDDTRKHVAGYMRPKPSVVWSSSGSMSIADARKFAAAILAACDWVDARKGEGA